MWARGLQFRLNTSTLYVCAFFGKEKGVLVVDGISMNLFCLMDMCFHIVKKNYLGINAVSNSAIYTVLIVFQVNDVLCLFLWHFEF